MTSPQSVALLLAIGLQESKFMHREQINGPARGWWQFEEIGVKGVLTHHSTSTLARELLTRLDYPVTAPTVYNSLARDSILAGCFARLLLYTVPDTLPQSDEPERAWKQYLSAWRPGKPHPETFPGHYDRAWNHVLQNG